MKLDEQKANVTPLKLFEETMSAKVGVQTFRALDKNFSNFRTFVEANVHDQCSAYNDRIMLKLNDKVDKRY
jgi:hypothetical protein